MKTICVFGADGRTGKYVVDQILQRGWSAVACVYNEKFSHSFPKEVTVKVGDILDQGAVTGAVSGTDAVISVVGHVKGSDPFMQTRGIQNVVRAMNEQGVRRIVSLTGTGVRISGDTPSTIDRFLNMAVRRIDSARVNDGMQHAEVLRRSGLDWTILRVLKLTNREAGTEAYRLTEHGPAELLTPRKKAARILVDQIERQAFLQKMPISSAVIRTLDT